MTEKERLAQQYYQDRPEGFGDPERDFLAGFDKGLVLAAELLLGIWNNPKYEAMHFKDAIVHIARDITDIGNEESTSST